MTTQNLHFYDFSMFNASFLLTSFQLNITQQTPNWKKTFHPWKAGINITYKKTLGNGKKDKQDEVEFIRA